MSIESTEPDKAKSPDVSQPNQGDTLDSDRRAIVLNHMLPLMPLAVATTEEQVLTMDGEGPGPAEAIG